MIKERIIQVVEYKELAKEKFYQDIGMSSANFRGKAKERPINSTTIENILTVIPDVNPEWLLTGEGSMLREEPNDLHINPFHNNMKSTEAKIVEQTVPLYSITAEAGLKDLFDSGVPSQVLDTIRIPNLPRCDGAITITGDSMYPLLKSGDMILYAITSRENIFYGEMYLLGIQLNDYEEFITVKYIHKSQSKDYIILASQNKHHDDKEIPISSIRSIALVKASIRINTML